MKRWFLTQRPGVEHMGRGTAEHVDTMLIVADANMKSLEIAKRIEELAAGASVKRVYLVGNKVGDKVQQEAIRNFAKENGLRILAFIPFDLKVGEMEMRGETPLKDSDSEAMRAIEGLSDVLTGKNN
jgi:CO dehydrogenase maturation factor